jgi:hypothetical protein
MMTDQVSPTCSSSCLRASSLVALGETALIQVIGRASLVECAVGTAEAVGRATGRHDRRLELRAWSALGASLMELELACRRLDGAGLVAEAAGLAARKDVRIEELGRNYGIRPADLDP